MHDFNRMFLRLCFVFFTFVYIFKGTGACRPLQDSFRPVSRFIITFVLIEVPGITFHSNEALPLKRTVFLKPKILPALTWELTRQHFLLMVGLRLKQYSNPVDLKVMLFSARCRKIPGPDSADDPPFAFPF